MSWKWTAIACGNTAVFKSAEQTPLTILYFAQLVEKAGFPPGVFNVVTGYGKDLGDALVKHLDICKIAFTGSTFAGQLIQKNAAVNLKALTLECGGKSPIVIFDDCKFEQAVKWTCIGIFSNMGQICSGTSRCYVQAGIYDKFIEALVDHLDKYYKIGDPFDDKTMVGPLITKIQQQRVLEYISTAIKEGCELVYGGLEKPQNISKCLEKGFYVRPTIFKDVEPHHTIFKEEVFGPVISITKFDEFDKVLESCNDNQYGLGAAIFTQDITRATVFAREIEAGMCWINSSNDVDMNVPFGGIKMSGVGRELGEYGLANFTNVKAVHLNLANDL
ncbi:related to aldehyde dehydrogenase [Saccharomycodes ludwigii]|uniref:Related to aldehyde dehydrogenase n=2 Tax=Saccharomycodes ludwigii TaxID=36035 RepID=A0A376BAT9_9ASCO|nr:related to aldehyde dehydrogenase [Saccharomycodes ludwigii]